MRHVVTDAAQERALEFAVSARATHDHARALIIGCLDDSLPWLAFSFANLPLHLHKSQLEEIKHVLGYLSVLLQIAW